MNSKLLKVLLAALISVSVAACDDDSKSDDKGSDSCTTNAKKCDGSNLMVCNNNAWGVSETCANGCDSATNACKSASDGGGQDVTVACKAGEKKCEGNTLYACSASNSWGVSESCANGCDSATNACKAGGSTTPDKPSTSDDDVSSCSADAIKNCQTKYAQYYEADEVTCVIKDGKESCIETCDKEGVTEAACYSSYSALVDLVCKKTKDGVLYWSIDEDSLKQCDYGCNSDGNACADKLVSDQGESCTASTRADKCDGNVLSYCGSSNKVVAGDCSKYDAVCATVDNGTYANCFAEEDECEKLGDTITVCDDYYSSSYTAECKAASNGKKYYVAVDGSDKECVNGCNEDGDACAAALVSDQGEKCSSDTRTERCDGSIASYCDDAYGEEYSSVEAYDCASYSMNCVSFANAYSDGSTMADCADSANACTTVGATQKSCYDSVLYSYVYTQKCAKASDGKNYWIVDDSKDPAYCNNYCAEDGSANCDSEGYEED